MRAPDALLASRNLRAPLRGACAGDWAARRLGNSAHTRQRQSAKRAERRLRRLQPACETTVASHVRLGRFAAPVRRVSRRRGRGGGRWCVQRCPLGQGVLVTLRSLERPPPSRRLLRAEQHAEPTRQTELSQDACACSIARIARDRSASPPARCAKRAPSLPCCRCLRDLPGKTESDA